MNRSRTQIASSYAPGALFTYEGGLGCCVSVPKHSPYTPKSPGVHKQLFEMLGEFVETWYARAISCRQAPEPEVLAEQCLDPVFLDHKDNPTIDPDRFVLNQPSRIGFMPDPPRICLRRLRALLQNSTTLLTWIAGGNMRAAEMIVHVRRTGRTSSDRLMWFLRIGLVPMRV